jgi:hypothetical protein
MNPTDSNALAEVINARNAQRMQRAEAGAGIVVALVLGILGALALVHWLTPCEGTALCMGAAFTQPHRAGWLRNLALRLRAAHLRVLIRWAEDDMSALRTELEYSHADLHRIPQQLRVHQAWIDARRIDLIDCERATQPPACRATP